MATIKVSSSKGIKELKCFDTLSEIPFLDPLTDEQKAALDAFLVSHEPTGESEEED